jgi:hypothetical protein
MPIWHCHLQPVAVSQVAYICREIRGSKRDRNSVASLRNVWPTADLSLGQRPAVHGLLTPCRKEGLTCRYVAARWKQKELQFMPASQSNTKQTRGTRHHRVQHTINAQYAQCCTTAMNTARPLLLLQTVLVHAMH